MDEELQRELDMLRKSQAEQEDRYEREAREGRRRLEQFVEEMKKRQIRPYPIICTSWETKVTPGTPGGLFKKAIPERREEIRVTKIIDYGWTVGYPVSGEDRGPYGLFDAEAVTTKGVLMNVMWGAPHADDGMPEKALVTHDGRKFYLRGSSLIESYGGNFTAEHVARLLRHYIDGQPSNRC